MKKEKLLLILAALLGFSFIALRKRKKGMQGIRSKLKSIAESERDLWGNGTFKEDNPAFLSTLREYWKAAGVTNKPAQWMIDNAWSAAFISYVFKKAGAGSLFKYNPSHSVYFQAAKANRAANNDNPFKAYRITEKPVEVGDLIGYGRQSGITYDTPGQYKAHSDIVVSVTPTEALSIGGNVSNSVKTTRVKLNNGYIDPSNTNPYFIIIKTS